MSLDSGGRIGPYEILSRLGAGGMGEVYRARDTRLARDVALKVLPDTFAADPERIARFEREAQILAALSHANIAGIYGLEISGPARVLVMELVEGESLEARLRRGPLSLDDTLAIAQQIGDALSAAHDRGIVHRDLKPANIMLTPNGSVKVLDFGLARMIEPVAVASGLSMSPTLSIQATLAGTILGTAPYMSPEQARGRTVDKRTDVWAFGCVLFEMLTGKRAFAGDDVTDTIALVVRGEPDWQALPAALPAHVTQTLRGCLTKDPAQRLGDIAVPLFLLSDATHGSDDGTLPVAAPVKPWWRRALPVAAAAFAATALTGGAAWFARPAPAAPALAKFTIRLPADQRFTNMGRKQIAVSPDGSQIVYVANGKLYLRSLAELEPRLIPGADAFKYAVVTPVFSPDGREIAFFGGDDLTLKRLAIAGGTAVTICPAANPSSVQWEEQGILIGQPGKGIFRVSPNGGTLQLVVPSAADEIASAAASLPDGRGLLYSVKKTSDSWDQATVMLQTANGERKTLVRNASDGRYDGAGHLLYAVSGVVMAAPFDLDRLEVSGGAAPAIEGVRRQLAGTGGTAQFDLALNEMLTYVPGPAKIANGAGDRMLAIFDGKDGMERLDLPVGTYQSPRVSPDGKTVVFEAGDDPDLNVWLQDLVGKSASRRLTFNGRNRAPVWSPDNQWIAFQSDRDGDPAVFRQRADGTGVAERLTTPDKSVRYTPQSWSGDGESLLLTADKGGVFDLHVLSLKNRTTSRYSEVRSRVPTEATFSPDGRWIVYQTSDKDPSDVRAIQSFVEPFPSTGTKHLVPLSGLAGHPYWSRQGNRLFFNSSQTRSTVVDVRTTPTVTFSPPRPFSRGLRTEPSPATGRRNSDALSDGRILGVTLDLGRSGEVGAGDEIVVVMNWRQWLQSRVPSP